MKYFLDTEFHEYKKKPLFGKPIDTIELISIGIASEDLDEPAYGGGKLIERSYYAICKEFDLKAAWNSWQPKDHNLPMGIIKEYWLRENVLNPIFNELYKKEYLASTKLNAPTNLVYSNFERCNNLSANSTNHFKFTLSSFTALINKYGKTKAQIAEEIYKFIYPEYTDKSYKGTINKFDNNFVKDYWIKDIYMNPEFYAYYADYDWVVFCWLFGRMIDLPKGFPKYCRDLKQMLDDIGNPDISKLKEDNTNVHNALSDAKWNRNLFNFITNDNN